MDPVAITSAAITGALDVAAQNPTAAVTIGVVSVGLSMLAAAVRRKHSTVLHSVLSFLARVTAPRS